MYNLLDLGRLTKHEKLQLRRRGTTFRVSISTASLILAIHWFLMCVSKLQFVEHMVRNLKDNLKSCNWSSARYCLRFLADLVNCHVISANSLLALFDNLLDAVKEEGVPMVRKDWYAYAVLSCLPWVGRELYEKKEQALNMLLTTIEVYLNKRSKKHLGVLRVWSTDNPHPQEEVSFGILIF